MAQVGIRPGEVKETQETEETQKAETEKATTAAAAATAAGVEELESHRPKRPKTYSFYDGGIENSSEDELVISEEELFEGIQIDNMNASSMRLPGQLE